MKQFYSLLIIFIFAHNVSAQKFSTFPSDPTMPFDPVFVETRDTVSIYGPHTITRNILQDREGNFWFTTWQGIMRYSGKQFTNVTLKDKLIHFHVNSIYEDKSGSLWFGTVREGLYRYDGKSFTLFTTKDGLADNNVACMFEDKAGNMWFGSDSGATRYDGKVFTSYKKQNGFNGIYVGAMIQDRTGRLWFSTNKGLYVFDGKMFIDFKNKEGAPFKFIWALKEDKDGDVWIGGANGLCYYNGKTVTNIKSNAVGNIFVDKRGKLWLEASEEYQLDNSSPRRKQILYVYDGKMFTKIIEKKEPDDCQVFGITEVKAGNIWFGTIKGACRYDGKSFENFKK